MATEHERGLLHEKAEYLRTVVASWVNGPRVARVNKLADELDVLAGEKEAPEEPGNDKPSGDGEAPA
jgi:hypothetical protein